MHPKGHKAPLMDDIVALYDEAIDCEARCGRRSTASKLLLHST